MVSTFRFNHWVNIMLDVPPLKLTPILTLKNWLLAVVVLNNAQLLRLHRVIRLKIVDILQGHKAGKLGIRVQALITQLPPIKPLIFLSTKDISPSHKNLRDTVIPLFKLFCHFIVLIYHFCFANFFLIWPLFHWHFIVQYARIAIACISSK